MPYYSSCKQLLDSVRPPKLFKSSLRLYKSIEMNGADLDR